MQVNAKKKSGSKTFLIWMAWRNLVARKGKSLSFMTLISVMGVGIGVAALVIVLSVMGGFEQDLRAKMFDGLAHLEVQAENELAGFSAQTYGVPYFRKLFPEAEHIESFTKADIILKRGKHLASATLFGLDPNTDHSIWGFEQGMILGHLADLNPPDPKAPQSAEHAKLAPGEKGIILGESLAIQLSADVGDTVNVLSPQAGMGQMLSGGTLSSSFKVVGIFHSEASQYDSKYALVTTPAGRKFLPDYDYSLDTEEYVSGMAINFPHPSDVDLYMERLTHDTGLRGITWKDANKSLLFALKLEKFTMSAILLLIVLVAAFSISGTMMMTVFHKRSQVALLRSLGMSRLDIARLFLFHGFSIGFIGVLLGMAFGLGICGLLYYFHFIDLPPVLYYQKKLPVKILPFEYCVISMCAWLLSLGAALYPAIIASRQDPGTGLRHV